jgi:signal transduction histidine kinase
LQRLRRGHPDIEVALIDGREVAVPGELDAVCQSVLREAVRNAVKHAHPTCIEVRLSEVGNAFALEIVNDGVPDAPRTRTAGMGLRLAAFEALEQGGVVDFGRVGDDRWRVRLTVPR